MRFRPDGDQNWGMMATAAAGPISNVRLAIVCGVVLAVAYVAVPHKLIPLELMQRAIAVNIALAIFNMLPVPPLDGSRVVAGLLPRSAWPAWKTFTRFSPIVLLMVVLAPGHLTSWLFEKPIEWTFSLLAALIKLLGG
jgi:Zn-dependent protease